MTGINKRSNDPNPGQRKDSTLTTLIKRFTPIGYSADKASKAMDKATKKVK